MSDYSTEEKIDYIFKELKSQKRWRIWKITFKLLIILFWIYIYMNFIQWINKDKIIKDFSNTIWEIVAPIAENIVNNMIKEQNIDTNNISPEMIEQLKKLNK